MSICTKQINFKLSYEYQDTVQEAINKTKQGNKLWVKRAKKAGWNL